MESNKECANFKEIQSDKLKIRIFPGRAEMGRSAAGDTVKKIKALLEVKSEVNIVFAAAPSQNEFLAELAENESVDWERVNAFHLDEYIGIDENAAQSFRKFLKDRLFKKLAFKSVNLLNGNAGNIEEECLRYSKLLEGFKPDIACIGIGENGHIAFNDPQVADFNDKRLVKPVELDELCRLQQVNDGCFDSIEKVPHRAITLTIPAIVSASDIFCMAPGKTKADAVFRTVRLGIDETCPASILRIHNNAVLYIDNDSAAHLSDEMRIK